MGTGGVKFSILSNIFNIFLFFAASTGSDYTAVSERMVTFAPGESTQTVSVILMDDEDYELSEDFIGRLSLEAGSSGVSIVQDTSMATIEDEDGGCGLISRCDRLYVRTYFVLLFWDKLYIYLCPSHVP